MEPVNKDEARRQTKKIWIEKNKDRIQETTKLYRQKHSEDINTKSRQYYRDNNEKLCEIINCGCGGKFQ